MFKFASPSLWSFSSSSSPCSSACTLPDHPIRRIKSLRNDRAGTRMSPCPRPRSRTGFCLVTFVSVIPRIYTFCVLLYHTGRTVTCSFCDTHDWRLHDDVHLFLLLNGPQVITPTERPEVLPRVSVLAVMTFQVCLWKFDGADIPSLVGLTTCRDPRLSFSIPSGGTCGRMPQSVTDISSPVTRLANTDRIYMARIYAPLSAPTLRSDHGHREWKSKLSYDRTPPSRLFADEKQGWPGSGVGYRSVRNAMSRRVLT